MKMNEEIKIARDRAHQGNALHDRATLRDQEFVDVTRELAASRQKAIDAKSDYLGQIAAMSEEIEETRRELKIQESFVYQLAETNKELESENATQVAIATDAKDRGRALLRDDSVRTSKRHNSKTRKSDTTNGPQQQGQVKCSIKLQWRHLVLVYRHPMFLSQFITTSDRVLFPVYQDPMIQAHIGQLHEAVGSIPNMRFGSTGNNGGGGGHGDGAGLGYHNTDGSAGGLGCAPVPAASGGPNPPDPPDDDDDDGDEDEEEEPSDDDDDDRRCNRRSPRRRRSRDRRDHDSGRPRISQKEAERVNVPPWPKITKLDICKMALAMNVTSASADPDIEVWMSWVGCAFVVNPDLSRFGRRRWISSWPFRSRRCLGVHLMMRRTWYMIFNCTPNDAKEKTD